MILSLSTAAPADRRQLLDKAAGRNFTTEIFRRTDSEPGFKVLPRRWLVERTFGWMSHLRHVIRDCDERMDVSKDTISVAMGITIVRRLAHR